MGSVKLMYNSSDNRCIAKSTTDKATYTCKFKSDCSIMNPELELNYHSGIFDANYCYIQDFGRYYYITDITVSQQRVFIKCKIDILMSYKSAILNMSAYYNRTGDESKSNLYLNDDRYGVQVNKFPAVIESDDPTGFGDYGDKSWVLVTSRGYTQA